MASKSSQNTSHKYLGFYLSGLVVVGLLSLLIWLFQSSLLVKQLHAWHLLYEPETFTELYFEDHLNLPRSLVTSKPQSFRFTIHNLEYKDMNYPFEVYLQNGDQKIFLSTDSANLKQDQYKTITETFSLPEKFKRVEVVVNLIDLDQSIHFWMPS